MNTRDIYEFKFFWKSIAAYPQIIPIGILMGSALICDAVELPIEASIVC